MIRYNTKRYWGYSGDTKPVDAQIGDRFLELDTKSEYFFGNYNSWNLIGASGGTISGGVNPTYDYIPVNSGGTFADSFIRQSGTTIETFIGGTGNGLQVDVSTGSVKLGDWNGITPIVGPYFEINNASDYLQQYANGSYINMDGPTRTITLGDWDAGAYNNTRLIVNDTSDKITLEANNGVGINTTSPTNALHISGVTDSLRIEGLVSGSTDNELLSIDSTGVVHKYPLSLISGGTGGGGEYLPLSGGTLTGDLIAPNITATTLNATGLTTTNGITSTGGITFKQVTINSSYTATTSDYMIDVTGGTFSVVLPSAVGIQGRLLVVKNNGGGAVTVQPVLGQNIDDKPFVILGETNTIQLSSNGANWVAISYNISTVNSSTGVFAFTGLSIASTTTFRVAPVKGWIVDDTTNLLSPQLYYVDFSGGTYTATYLTSYTETYIYLTSGGTIEQTYLPLTEQQRRQNIFLGKLGHANKTNIINAFSQPDFVLSPLSQLRDMFQPIKFINGGIYPYASAADKTFATTAGYLYGLGINFHKDTLNPSQLYVTGNTVTTFQYRTQTGGTSSNTTLIDPLNYDLNGVITSVNGTKATNQRIYLVQNGVIRVQYGQTEHTNLAEAISKINTETFNTFSNFSGGSLKCILVFSPTN